MINELKAKYRKDKITKKEYFQELFKIHNILFEYSELINDGFVESIEINKQSVVININEYDRKIKMNLEKVDEGSIIVNYLNGFRYENEELEMTLNILKCLEDKAVVFDIGANLGWYTINIKKHFPLFNVYSFEPVEEIYNKMKANISLNGIPNDLCYNIGFYNKENTMNLYYNKFESGASSIMNIRESVLAKLVTCKFIKLDDFIRNNNINRLDFIKCDVEGAEYFVYEGGLDYIRYYKPVIFSEMLRKWASKFGYHPNRIIELLSELKYKCYVIESGKLKEIFLVNEETIETNYFFLHSIKHNLIINKFA